MSVGLTMMMAAAPADIEGTYVRTDALDPTRTRLLAVAMMLCLRGNKLQSAQFGLLKRLAVMRRDQFD